MHIAIDGSVASGKGTVARRLSERLEIPCLDTGALYRGVAVYARMKGVGEFDIAGLNMTAQIKDGVTHVLLDDKDVTDKLRDNEISTLSSNLATRQEVRNYCTALAQQIAKNQSLIMEGRDICNVVLPFARYKFLLTADVKIRAKRRQADLQARGQIVPFKDIVKQTKARDKSDRKKGGFKKIKDAIKVDCSKMTVDEVVQFMLGYISR